MKAQKLPSGAYRVRVSIDGKRISVTAQTADEAIYEAMALKTKRIQKQKSFPTVGECVNEYIKSKENILSPKTIYSYRTIRDSSLKEIEDIPINELTQQRIQILVNTLALTKSPKTVHNAHNLLSSVLSVYLPDFRLRTTLPRIPKRIKELPTAEDLMKAVLGSEIELPCLMGLWLGMRLSEILGAKKTDIKGGILHIHNTIVTVGGKQVEKDMTKTVASTRRIALPEHIIELISLLPPEQEYLVTLKGQAIYKKFKRLVEVNNLPEMTFHDLRHLNASVMLALNIPDKYAMERGGWSTDKVMKTVYQHTFTAERKAVDRKVDDYFIELLDTKTDTEKEKPPKNRGLYGADNGGRTRLLSLGN